jgi:hypothetical protein
MHIRLEHIQHAAGLGRQHGAAHRRRRHLRRAVFTKAFAACQQARPGVTVNYASVGSSADITGSPPGR